MRRLIVLGSLVVAIVVFLPFAGFLTARNVTSSTCDGDGISQPIIPGPTPDVPGLSDGQVRLAKIIWLEAHRLSSRLGGPADQAAVIAVAVASQESTLGANPSINRPNADGDAGPFQQRTLPGWYGTLAQVTDPTYAANTFLLGHTVTAEQYAQAVAAGSRAAGAVGYHITGLADVPDWANIDIIDAADQVQRSAFPDAVADDIPMARKLVAMFNSGSSSGLATKMVGAQLTHPCGGPSAASASGEPPTKIISGKAVTPVEHYTITATFGEVGSWARYHTGLDFAAPIGTPVRAALTGTVTHAGYGGAARYWAGDYVTIKHADGTSTLYAHMSATYVRPGQSVMTGERVGAIGVTGRSFGPHLHFETYPIGTQPGDIYRATDPAIWLNGRGVDLSGAGVR